MFIPRDVHTFPEIYKYYTKSTVRWIGTTFSNMDTQMAAPFLRYGKDNTSTFGLKFGYIYSGDGGTLHFKDSTESNYDTGLAGDFSNWLDIDSDSYYFNQLLIGEKSVQAVWEGSLYRKYYESAKKVHELLYSDIPWLDYFLFYNVRLVNYNGAQAMTYQSYRPKTAEELRLFVWSDLIRGCKGI